MSNIADNFTKFPNSFIDSCMSQLSDPAFKILAVITRKTVGWNKDVDCISLTQFEKMTGKSRSTVVKALNELLEKKLIKTGTTRHCGKEYSLTGNTDFILNQDPQKNHCQLTGDDCLADADGSKNKPVQDLDPSSLKNAPLLVESLDTHKENLNKDKKEKKEVFSVSELKIPSNVNVDHWKSFIQMREEINNPLTPSGAKALLKKLEEYGIDANQSLINAIIGNYSNVLEPKKAKSEGSGNRRAANTSSTIPRRF